MDDRDSKKLFIIPKTHTSNKDVVISEKPDSRNVTELFEDIKSYALDAHFDFRQKSCKSCDTIRNQKLQKLYNEKRLKMKKEQDPIERLAFHLVTYRDVAVNVANDGLHCEQLSFPIEKYLGNPKDGIHLSRRPDVVLTSSGAQGLYRFGLLVCKVLLGKGYPTLPSTVNHQLAAQVNYDHHYCKIQAINKEQRHIDDLLANSLIFCYEHENFEPVSHPSQILPIAILWYDLKDKFPPELTSTHLSKTTLSQESQQRNGKIVNGRVAIKSKTSKPAASIPDKTLTSTSGTWDTFVPETSVTEQTPTVNTSESSIIAAAKYPSHLMVPFHRVYSTPAVVVTTNNEETSPNTPQVIQSSRDPRLSRAKRDRNSLSSDTNPLSPQSAQIERSLSENPSTTKSLSDEPILIAKSSSLTYIPLNSSSTLLDPRLKTSKLTRSIFFLEPQAVKHALQLQKRLNHYHDSKSGLPPRTSYSPVPYIVREVSNEEYERLINKSNDSCKPNKHSNGVDYSALHISVFECFNLALEQPSSTGSMCIDLERMENKVAYEQIEMYNELVQREKQLNSQQIRLRLREKRQRRIQQHLNEKKNLERHNSKSTSLSPSLSASSKSYIATGRKLLKDHQISSTRQFSPDLLGFLSQEYRTETRSHVKQLVAELVGIFLEKYHPNSDVIKTNGCSVEESHADSRTINSVIDMDVDSPSSQGLCDHDERFRVPTPPLPPLPPPLALPPLPPALDAVLNSSMLSVRLAPSLPSEPNKMFVNSNYNARCEKLFEEIRQHKQKEMKPTTLLIPAKTEATLLPEEVIVKKCVEQFEFSSSEGSSLDDNQCPNEDEDVQDEDSTLLSSLHDATMVMDEDSNRFRDEFVKLLTKEAYISKSSSPTNDQRESKQIHEHTHQRRRSHDESDNKIRKDGFLNHSNSLNNANRHIQSSEKKISSTRTVTLVSNRTAILTENHSVPKQLESPLNANKHIDEEPTTKRIKVDSILSPVTPTDESDNHQIGDSNGISSKSGITVSIVNSDHDYRRDLNEKRRTTSKLTSSRSRSRSPSNDRHRPHYSQRHRSPSHNPSNKPSMISSESTTRSRNHSPLSSSSSSSRSSSHDNRHRSQQTSNRIEHHSERKRSFGLPSLSTERQDKFNDTSYRNTLSTVYRQRNVDDTIQPHNSHSHSQQQPSGHRRFNYNHQSVANHPRFANISPLSSAPSINYDYAKASSDHHRHRSPASVSMIDRNVTSSYTKPNQIEPEKVFYTDYFDFKPSATIECLQMFLQKKTTD